MKSHVLLLILIFISGFVSGQRIVRTLNSGWLFNLDNNPEKTEQINIPHTWNNKDAFQYEGKYYRGVGTYTKSIFIPAEYKQKRLFLHFEGANQVVELYVNNEFVGKHKGGYTGFVFEITDYLIFGKENIFKVKCNNKYNSDIPPLEADFNFYGGIYRDIYLIVTEPVHFEIENEACGNLMVQTPFVSDDSALVKINGSFFYETGTSEKYKVNIQLFDPYGNTIADKNKIINTEPTGKYDFNFELDVETPYLWSPETPHLYTIETSVSSVKANEVYDKISTSFGCRWFHIDPEKGFFLNGKHYELMGVNRHQDYENLGNALPNDLHKKDYELIKNMGCNFVRLAHYPQDPYVYQLCDELGLLIWSEIPVINDVTNSEAYFQNCLQMQREQVKQLYNHPSVIIWGYMNEIFIRTVFGKKLTEDEKLEKINTSLKLAKGLESQTKTLDTIRYTAMALHNNQMYNTTGIADIPDIIGWNLYFGWYDKTLEDLGPFLDEEHRKYPQRPVIISEYGPGSDVRIQTNNPKPWDYSEAYQIKSHESYYKQVTKRPFILGMAAWNFADFGSSGRQDTRPFINQKGLLNFDRTPKDIYYYYQSLLLKEPYLFISGTFRNNYFAEDSLDKGKVRIMVFSNQDSVSLYVDNQIFKSSIINGLASFNLLLTEGQHELVAKTRDTLYKRSINIYLRSNLLSYLDKNPLNINVGSHCDYTDPVTNQIWIYDQEYKEGGWGYIGGSVFQQTKNKYQGTAINIKGIENDPLYQTMREGIEAYKFDVKKGTYRLTLLFAEYNTKASKNLIYNLNNEVNETNIDIREFSLKINNNPVIHNLNLASEYGVGQAAEISFVVESEDGILVEFEKITGKTILSGISIEKVY